MKMSPEDFQTLQTIIKKHVTKEMLAQHREGLKQRKDCKDREMRLRWDALWYSERKDRKALELRVLVNGKTYACVKYEREKAISSILFDVRQETGMDLSSLLPGMVSRKERG